MTATKKAQKTTQVANTRVKTETAPGQMHHGYKFGRYLSDFLRTVIANLWPPRPVPAADSAPAAPPAVVAEPPPDRRDSQDRQKDRLMKVIDLLIGEDPQSPKTKSGMPTGGDCDFYWQICKPPAAEPAPEDGDVQSDSRPLVHVSRQGNR